MGRRVGFSKALPAPLRQRAAQLVEGVLLAAGGKLRLCGLGVARSSPRLPIARQGMVLLIRPGRLPHEWE